MSELNRFRDYVSSSKISYSQTLQDVFALAINDYKTGGYFVDIGCGGAYGIPGCSNNQLLRDVHSWSGICIDADNWSESYSKFPSVKFFQIDATSKDQLTRALGTAPSIIDYLSFDIDDATVDCLRCLDLTKYKFKCITIEHNKYLGARGNQSYEQREILSRNGYHLLIKNFHQYEDWWVHSDLVDINRFKLFEQLNDVSMSHTDYRSNEMILETLTSTRKS